MGLPAAIPEEVIEFRRVDGLPRFSNFILNKLHRMNGTGSYFHFRGGPCRNQVSGCDALNQ